MPEAAQKRVVLVVALAVALLVGGTAQQALAKKRSHTLSADYKSGRIGVDDTTPTTMQTDDQGSLAGRPFGSTEELNELTLVTYNAPNCLPFCTGTEHTTFKADFPGRGIFRGFYDFSFGSEGNPSSPITGTITGGSGAFRGAKGRFQVVNRVAVPVGDTTGYTAHWQGSIRY
jgi:hypothetical protein